MIFSVRLYPDWSAHMDLATDSAPSSDWDKTGTYSLFC